MIIFWQWAHTVSVLPQVPEEKSFYCNGFFAHLNFLCNCRSSSNMEGGGVIVFVVTLAHCMQQQCCSGDHFVTLPLHTADPGEDLVYFRKEEGKIVIWPFSPIFLELKEYKECTFTDDVLIYFTRVLLQEECAWIYCEWTHITWGLFLHTLYCFCGLKNISSHYYEVCSQLWLA